MCRTRFQNRRIDPKISSNRQTNKEWDGQKEKNNKCHTRTRTIHLVQQIVEVATKSSLC